MTEATEPTQNHLEWLRQAGYSDATLTARADIIHTLPPLADCDRTAVRAWWDTRQNRMDGGPKADSTRSGEASHARAYWEWAVREGLMDRNPGDWLPKIRQAKPMAVAVGEGDLFRAITDAPGPMRRMIALAAMAGLRSAEIAVVTWADIDRDNGVLWIRQGKGKKDRSVPLSAGLLAELGDPGEGPIIGKPMTAKAVSAALARYLRREGVDYTAHKLRARYLTRFIAATGDAVAAAKVAGHADLSTILRYAVASDDTMRRGAEAAGRIG